MCRESTRTLFARVLVIGMVVVSVAIWNSASVASEGRLNYTLVAVDAGPTKDGVEHTFVITGSGSFTTDEVDGGGTYIHLDMASEVPKTILGSGSWTPTKVVQWIPAKDNATYAGVRPGILDLLVDLTPDNGEVMRDVPLRINCNVGFAGIVNEDPKTGEKLAEGYWITTPAGSFEPKDPVLGLTSIGLSDIFEHATNDSAGLTPYSASAPAERYSITGITLSASWDEAAIQLPNLYGLLRSIAAVG